MESFFPKHADVHALWLTCLRTLIYSFYGLHDIGVLTLYYARRSRSFWEGRYTLDVLCASPLAGSTRTRLHTRLDTIPHGVHFDLTFHSDSILSEAFAHIHHRSRTKGRHLLSLDLLSFACERKRPLQLKNHLYHLKRESDSVGSLRFTVYFWPGREQTTRSIHSYPQFK